MKYDNKREEITDIIDPFAFEDPKFKPGLVLKMEKATIKLTKVDRKNKRAWGEHIVLVNQAAVAGHYGHLINSTREVLYLYGAPLCTECNVPVGEPTTREGRIKATVQQGAEDGKE